MRDKAVSYRGGQHAGTFKSMLKVVVSFLLLASSHSRFAPDEHSPSTQLNHWSPNENLREDRHSTPPQRHKSVQAGKPARCNRLLRKRTGWITRSTGVLGGLFGGIPRDPDQARDASQSDASAQPSETCDIYKRRSVKRVSALMARRVYASELCPGLVSARSGSPNFLRTINLCKAPE